MESCSSRLLVVAITVAVLGLAGSNFQDDCHIDWAPQNVRFTDNGRGVSLQLDRSSGCRLRTKESFVYGTVSTLVRLVPGDSAGSITAFYTSSAERKHDEIDFEFLGNVDGQPYTFHTNIFVADVGNREVQFSAWFDPSAGFHSYTITWKPCMVVWYVDSVPIRVFRNYQASHGVAFPTSQPMSGYMSIWATEADCATHGGRVKTDWSKAPFVANYRDLEVVVAHGGSCHLSNAQVELMLAIQDKYMLYNYCRDNKRFNGQMPSECALPQY